MNYIWEILLRARANGVLDENLFFAQAKECSPWYEQSFPCLNEDTVTGPVVEINSLCRFSSIFQELLHEMGNSEYLRFLFDVGIHVLADQETMSGVSKRDFYVQKLLRDMEKGEFCTSVSQTFQTLSDAQKHSVASLLLAQYETGSSLLMFRQSLTLFYPQAILYQLKLHPEQLLLYLGLTNANMEIIQMLQDLFLPLQYQVRIFWSKHFGVWDVDATMIFDEIEIY